MKSIRVLFATLTIATIITGAFAFTKNTKKFSMVVFQYTGTRPVTASSVVDPNSWTQVSSPSYTAPAEVLGFIEFDDATYPLVNNKPNLSGDVTLSSTIANSRNDPTKHQQTINGIKFYFTEQSQ